MTPEIRSFEYALGLFTILIGLALADIGMSFHRLVRRGSAVVWDPLALLATLYAVLIAVGMWFDIWAIRDVAATRNFFFYLSALAELYVVFLLAASSLPDERDEETNLRAYYQKNHRYFWTLVLLFQVSYYGHYTYFAMHRPYAHLAHDVAVGAVAITVALGLLWLRARPVHYVGLAVVIALALWDRARYSIN
jgi:hypothetical protein